MWPFSRRSAQGGETLTDLQRVALHVLYAKEHKGQQLDRCRSDVDRRSLCLQWAGAARNAYYEGRKQTIADMIISTDPRYKRMDVKTREAIGELKWGKSVYAKELVGLEQMYARWAVQYAGGPGSS